jgi:hypothetical protein
MIVAGIGMISFCHWFAYGQKKQKQAQLAHIYQPEIQYVKN